MSQRVKNPPAMQEKQETWVPSLGWEDPLEMEMATRSSILALKPHGQRNLEGYSPWDRKEWDTTKHAGTAHPAETSRGTELCSLFYRSSALAVYFTDGGDVLTYISMLLLCSEPVSPNRPREQVHHSNAKTRREFISSALGPKSHPTQGNPTRASNKGVWRLTYRQFFVSVTGIAGVT